MNLKICLILVTFIGFGGCISSGPSGNGSPGAQVSTDDRVVSSKSTIRNFNPRMKIDLSNTLNKYPNLVSVTAAVSGVTGASVSADELRSNPVVVLSSPGLNGRIVINVYLEDGSFVQEVL